MIYPIPRIQPAGDAAALVEVGDEIGEEAHDRVRGLDVSLAGGRLAGIIETIPAYASLLIQYDPAILTFDELASRLLELAEAARVVHRPEPRLHEIPVAYGGEHGPDLAGVAAAHRLAPEQVVAFHSGTIYTVYMLGFAPGFAYMGTVPEAISTPRLETPRVEVPAGSVGIAGRQTGIYPQTSPGGWRILGRTGVSLFNPDREPPSLLQAGDRIRFVPSSAEAAGVERDPEPRPVSVPCARGCRGGAFAGSAGNNPGPGQVGPPTRRGPRVGRDGYFRVACRQHARGEPARRRVCRGHARRGGIPLLG